ncbi:MAG: tetratricopeptide repeat protein [Planctomycetes bacterium]|nr:tetratricopeptide repeat protein [Planctomycetota bacterium]
MGETDPENDLFPETLPPPESDPEFVETVRCDPDPEFVETVRRDTDPAAEETALESGPEFAATLVESASGSSSSAARLREQIGGFRIESELARGGMGVVYVAHSPALDRRVALKVMIGSDLADADALERFRREAQAAARLRHPGVVAVHEVGEDDGLPYIVMDLIEGESLKSRLVREGPLPEREAARVTETLARALAHAHENGILHRDLKPANVLLTEEGDPVLTDFGLAKVVEADTAGPTRTGQIMGTPAYMPPEQADGRAGQVDVRADVYSLGATLYHMLTGEPPFKGRSAMKVVSDVIWRDPAAPSRLRAGLSRDLETICLRCLEKDPERRYPSANALGDDLLRFLRDEPVEARRPGPVERIGKWRRRNRAIVRVVGIAAATLLVFGGGAIAWVADTRAKDRAQRRADKANRTRLREAEATNRRREVLALIAQAKQGSLSHAEARQTAVRGILRNADSGTTQLLIQHLDEICDQLGRATDEALLSVRMPTPAEARVGEKQIAGLKAAIELRGRLSASVELPKAANEALHAASERLVEREGRLKTNAKHPSRAMITARRILARRQANALGMGRLDAADLICSALGNFEPEPAITASLINYLAVVEDEQRALAAGIALCRHATPHALEVIVAAYVRLGGNGPFAEGIRDALGNVNADHKVHSPLREPTKKGYLRRAQARATLGDLSGAFMDLNRGLQIAPKDPRLLNLRASVRQEQGDLKGARLDFDAAIAADEQAATPWYNRARLRRQTGDLAGARADYDRALLLRPRFAVALTNRASVRLAQGDPSGALKDVELALEEAPGLAKAWNTRGRVHREQGRSTAAQADFVKTTELDPTLVAGWINLAAVYRDQLRWVEALAAANRALALNPKSHKAFGLRAYAKSELGDVPGALLDLDEAIKLAPNDQEYRSERGRFRDLTGDVEGSTEDLDHAIKIARSDPQTFLDRSVVRKRRGDLKGALADCDLAIKVDASYASGWSQRGLVRQALGQPKRALADHKESIRLAPKSATSWNNLGTCLRDLGRSREALEVYTRALAFDPGVARTWSNRGATYEALREFKLAKDDYDRSLEIDATFPGTWFNRGNVKTALGDPKGARADYTRALKLDPKHVDSLANRANSYTRERAFELALADYGRAIQLAPRDPKLLSNRSRVHFAKRDAPSAIRDLLAATRLAPTDPELWLSLGNVRGATGDLGAAREAFLRALEIAPDHLEARLACGMTYEYQGDRKNALASYDLAIKSDPKSPKARSYRASIRAKGSDYEGAIADYSVLLKLDPKFVHGWRLRGELSAQAGHRTNAIADLRTFLERAPRDKSVPRIRALLEKLENGPPAPPKPSPTPPR